MGCFDSLKKIMNFNNDHVIKAPLTGEIIPIEEVPDPIFANKIVGDGIAINPTSIFIDAPCDGDISKIFETNHAFSMETLFGVELFVHFGIDTVQLKGKGFRRIAREGEKIKLGDPVIAVDLIFLKKKAKSVITSIIISNMDDVSYLKKFSGSVISGKDDLLFVKMK